MMRIKNRRNIEVEVTPLDAPAFFVKAHGICEVPNDLGHRLLQQEDNWAEDALKKDEEG